jgi:hypothetical protein
MSAALAKDFDAVCIAGGQVLDNGVPPAHASPTERITEFQPSRFSRRCHRTQGQGGG